MNYPFCLSTAVLVLINSHCKAMDFSHLSFRTGASEDCTTGEEQSGFETSLTKCAVLCAEPSVCGRFLYCPQSRICVLGGSLSPGDFSQCTCYTQANTQFDADLDSNEATASQAVYSVTSTEGAYTSCTSGTDVESNEATQSQAAYSVTSTETYPTGTTQLMCLNGGVKFEETCQCVLGFYGNTCQHVIRDCTEGTDRGLSTGRQVTFVKPLGVTDAFQVLCNFDFGMTYLSYQGTPSCPNLSFNRLWDDYVNGFGTKDCDHWLGLEKLHIFTKQGSYELEAIIDVGYTTLYCFYPVFGVNDSSTDYTAFIQPSGNSSLCDQLLGVDCGLDIDGKPFSTADHHPAGVPCAVGMKSGWWFGPSCKDANPMGPQISVISYILNPGQNRLSFGGPIRDDHIQQFVLRIRRN